MKEVKKIKYEPSKDDDQALAGSKSNLAKLANLDENAAKLIKDINKNILSVKNLSTSEANGNISDFIKGKEIERYVANGLNVSDGQSLADDMQSNIQDLKTSLRNTRNIVGHAHEEVGSWTITFSDLELRNGHVKNEVNAINKSIDVYKKTMSNSGNVFNGLLKTKHLLRPPASTKAEIDARLQDKKDLFTDAVASLTNTGTGFIPKYRDHLVADIDEYINGLDPDINPALKRQIKEIADQYKEKAGSEAKAIITRIDAVNTRFQNNPQPNAADMKVYLGKLTEIKNPLTGRVGKWKSAISELDNQIALNKPFDKESVASLITAAKVREPDTSQNSSSHSSSSSKKSQGAATNVPSELRGQKALAVSTFAEIQKLDISKKAKRIIIAMNEDIKTSKDRLAEVSQENKPDTAERIRKINQVLHGINLDDKTGLIANRNKAKALLEAIKTNKTFTDIKDHIKTAEDLAKDIDGTVNAEKAKNWNKELSQELKTIKEIRTTQETNMETVLKDTDDINKLMLLNREGMQGNPDIAWATGSGGELYKGAVSIGGKHGLLAKVVGSGPSDGGIASGLTDMFKGAVGGVSDWWGTVKRDSKSKESDTWIQIAEMGGGLLAGTVFLNTMNSWFNLNLGSGTKMIAIGALALYLFSRSGETGAKLDANNIDSSSPRRQYISSLNTGVSGYNTTTSHSSSSGGSKPPSYTSPVNKGHLPKAVTNPNHSGKVKLKLKNNGATSTIDLSRKDSANMIADENSLMPTFESGAILANHSGNGRHLPNGDIKFNSIEHSIDKALLNSPMLAEISKRGAANDGQYLQPASGTYG